MSGSAAQRGLKRRLLASPLVDVAASCLTRMLPRRAGDLAIAMFHRAPDAGRFGAQLDALHDHAEPVTGRAVLAALDGGVALPRRAVWITFDDAYRSFRDVAWPVLEGRGLAATLFVPTAFPGSGVHFWWERLAAAFATTAVRSALLVQDDGLRDSPLATPAQRKRALERARAAVKARAHEDGMALVEELLAFLGGEAPEAAAGSLNWNELRSLAARGVEFGCHTRNHPMLDRVAPDTAREEIRAGYRDLEREGLQPLPVLAYPSGQTNAALAKLAADEGVRCAVTTAMGFARLGTQDPRLLPRIAVGPDASAAAVMLRLAWAQASRRSAGSRTASAPRTS